MKTKQLIQELREEIEKIAKGCNKSNKELLGSLLLIKEGDSFVPLQLKKCGDRDKGKIYLCDNCSKKLHEKQAQLQFAEKVKQKFKEILNEIDDMREDVLDLIEICNKKEDLLSKMKILLETHKQIIKEKSGFEELE